MNKQYCKKIRVKELGLIYIDINRIFNNDHIISYGNFKKRYMFYSLQEAIRLFKIDLMKQRDLINS